MSVCPLHCAVPETHDHRSPLGVAEPDERVGEVLGGDARRLALEPLVFREGEQGSADLVRRAEQRLLGVDRRHRPALNALEQRFEWCQSASRIVPQTAAPTPVCWARVSRSPRTAKASATVTTVASEESTATIEIWPRAVASA